ncbi:MAG: hypothetical protein ACI9UK_000873 [Candidatus Krumholzibacteriia bacterium]|jgi:hypothetical protein
MFMILASVSGCSQEGAKSDQSAEVETSSSECAVEVDSGAWHTFAGLADRLASGQAVPRDELEAYANLPVVAKWRQSQAPNVPAATNMANWIEAAWWDQQGKTGRKKLNPDRVVLGRLYRYSQTHRAQIDALIGEFETGDLACRAYEEAATWIDPSLLPNPLKINFVPSAAEIRIFENEVFIDTSVLRAGGAPQTSRQITALLYRKFGTKIGEDPTQITGAASVAECVRLMMNEGIASFVEGTLEIEFDTEHPSLYKINIIPSDFFRKTQETVANLDLWLAPLIKDDDAMEAGGLNIARSLVGNNAIGRTGFGMAMVISARLGNERLLAVNGSVSKFLATYQEAALMNASPAPDPGERGIKLYESVPPLQNDTYEALQKIVDSYFTAE